MAILSQASHDPDWKVQRLAGCEGVRSNTVLAPDILTGNAEDDEIVQPL